MWGHSRSKKVAVYKPRRETSGKNQPSATLIFDFYPPELWEDKLLGLFKPAGLVFYNSSPDRRLQVVPRGQRGPVSQWLVSLQRKKKGVWILTWGENTIWRWRRILECHVYKPRNSMHCWPPPEGRREIGTESPSQPPEVTKHAGTLILDFWPPELWENTFLLLKWPSLW